jgi:hypothetical protein
MKPVIFYYNNVNGPKMQAPNSTQPPLLYGPQLTSGMTSMSIQKYLPLLALKFETLCVVRVGEQFFFVGCYQ